MPRTARLFMSTSQKIWFQIPGSGFRVPEKKGGHRSGPQSYPFRCRLELEPDAHAHVERRLELRRVAGEDGADRLPEVRIGHVVVLLRVLRVRRHSLLVEQVEHV